MLTLKEFKEARGVLSGVIRNTSLVYSPAFSKATGNQIYIKPENMQVTGAYKIRGAYYKISTLSDEEKARGLVTASAGNHAQGVAYAAQAAGVSATIVMPTTTPLVKVNNTKDYGAKVVLHGETFDDAAELAAKLSEEEGLTYVHPFNDPAIATGQGTISYEIFQDLPDVDVILVPIGGGGLATGVSTLAKLLNPNVTVIGVEPSGAASMKASLDAGHVVTLDRVETIADGVAVKTPGDQIFPYIQKNIDDIITIPDDELVDAFLDMMEKHKMIVENAGLLPIAAAGCDIDALMAGAAKAREELAVCSTQNECYRYAAARNILYRKGKSVELMACYEPNFTMMNEWYKQLFGESEGKDQKGLFPASVIFSTDLHSMGQFVPDGARIMFETVVDIKQPQRDLYIEKSADNFDGLDFLAGQDMSVVNRKAMEGTILAHTDGGVPNIILEVDSLTEADLGYLIYFFEKACAISGYMLGVNPFNQPGVESYKKNMFALLGKPGYEAQKAELEAKLR